MLMILWHVWGAHEASKTWRTCDGNYIIDLNQEYHTILLITNAVPRSHRGLSIHGPRGINLN